MQAKNIEIYNLANKTRRFFALAIDATIIEHIKMFIDGFILNKQPSFYETFDFRSAIPCLLLFLFKDSIKGQSFGKWFMEIKVSDISGKNTSCLKLALRNLFLLIPFLEFVVLLFSKDNKRIGDIVCSTAVVQNQNNLIFVHKAIIFVLLIAVLFFVSTLYF